MLSVCRVNSEQASTYYTKDDYYLQDVGYWHGQTGTALGYTGVIKEKDFQALIRGLDNHENPRFEIQSGGHKNIHTAGVDLTFSAPKSVSIAGLVLEDSRVIEAHNAAVDKTLDYIEKYYTNVRVHENQQVYTEHSGNLLAAKFQHMSSRELDPQLHTHCLVMNMSINKDSNMRAMDFGDIYKAKMFLGQMYRSELAANLKELGYQIESDSKGLFEIKGVPESIMQEFSGRSEQIKERFEALKNEYPNRNHAELKSQATEETRRRKDEPSHAELKEEWSNRIYTHNISYSEIKHSIENQPTPRTKLDINTVIDRALAVATEHEAITRQEDILRVAAKFGMGEYRVSELKEALDKSHEVIKLDDNLYTTFAIAEMERKIIAIVLDGKDHMPGMEQFRVRGLIQEYETTHGFRLTDGQRNAVMHTLNTPDRFIAIQGDAGTGKTMMLDVVRTIAEKENMEVVGLSFTGKAASEIAEASKINSRTIASLIGSQDDLKGKLVIIDEASMLSIKDMNSIINRCADETKVVLIGDTKQLQTLGQGKIFSSLQEHGINTVRMSEVQRQINQDYKDVVDKLSDKKITEAFNKLDQLDKIQVINDRDKRLAEVVKTYLEKPKETIIVTASNNDKEELNKLIRENLINKTSIAYKTRELKNLNPEEKSYANSYNTKDIIIANTAGIIGKAGAEGRIESVDKDKNMLTVRTAEKSYTIDLSVNGKDLQVYTEKNREFAEGDKILFLKNDRGLGVKNGQTAYITHIDKNHTLSVKLDNGKQLTFNPEAQYKYIAHGYALTDYKSQGQTAKNVIYHADTDTRVNYNQFYVGVTRGKENITVFTNDKQELKQLAQQEQIKTSTLEHDLHEARAQMQTRLEALAEKPPKTQFNELDKFKHVQLETSVANTQDKQVQQDRGKEFER